MVSEKQQDANRQNSKCSTGPKTPKGKAIVSKNALKYGLQSQHILLPTENKQELNAFKERIWSVLQPIGELEELLVDRIIVCIWRLRRIIQIEAHILQDQMDSPLNIFCGEDSKPNVGLAFVRDCNDDSALPKLTRYETTTERSFYKALHELQRIQAIRQGQNAPLPVAVDVNLDNDTEAA